MASIRFKLSGKTVGEGVGGEKKVKESRRGNWDSTAMTKLQEWVTKE